MLIKFMIKLHKQHAHLRFCQDDFPTSNELITVRRISFHKCLWSWWGNGMQMI